MVDHIKININKAIFDSELIKMVSEKIEKLNWKDYYNYEYSLSISLPTYHLTENHLENFSFSHWRSWYTSYDFLKKLELALRIVVSDIKESLEDRYFNIETIYVKSDAKIKQTKIELVKVGTYDYVEKDKKLTKFHLNLHFLDGKNLVNIVDLINYQEYDFYIDERNNNKNFFNYLLLKKEQGQSLKIEELSNIDWKQLILKEKVTNKELANLYEVSEQIVKKERKKYLPNVKQYYDEYIIYEVMFYGMNVQDYYSNFCIPLLEQMKAKNIKVVYEYANEEYHELFQVEEELKRQKEIERNNLAGKPYIMPLSGVFLKKLFLAILNKQVDRKFLKNNWFATYYGADFCKGYIEKMKNTHILELYESGKIYEHKCFEPYQDLYKRLQIEETENQSTSTLSKIPLGETTQYVKKQRKTRKIVPRDYLELEKRKNEVGQSGQELVYNYEREMLKDYPTLQEKIEKTYLIDEGAGYDLKSYDYNGKEIFIEVKANKLNLKNRIKFFISRNEDEFIMNHKNAYIYYVYDLQNPKLRVIDQKTYLKYYKQPINFLIDEEIKKP